MAPWEHESDTPAVRGEWGSYGHQSLVLTHSFSEKMICAYQTTLPSSSVSTLSFLSYNLSRNWIFFFCLLVKLRHRLPFISYRIF